MASSSLSLQLFKLSFLLSLFLNSELSESQSIGKGGPTGKLPPSTTCISFECPVYDVIKVGKGYEIRRYNSPVWITTAPIGGSSFVEATKTGFLQLFGYIGGNNSRGQKIEMAAPVITQVLISVGRVSSFAASFYLPKENQANPPLAKGLHIQRWAKATHVAVRRFSGFVNDTNVVQEAAALRASLGINSVPLSTDGYTVAQYNAPFQLKDRVNEIWLELK